ncbi:hypothetical protein HYFRA_00006803 [Hymenoscyphus fraxineus]|uniref:Uncharacterized protein n=1 Tax=Hymenoscyphus fraxineus TaxID=746836 RepID=A0A9N9KQK4_9HELO|nr:hypothetical protein HYFRA_00006803 [Hymenoscyphus fraxineus]
MKCAFRGVAKVVPILKDVHNITQRVNSIENGSLGENINARMNREIRETMKTWARTEEKTNMMKSFNTGIELYKRSADDVTKLQVPDLLTFLSDRKKDEKSAELIEKFKLSENSKAEITKQVRVLRDGII